MSSLCVCVCAFHRVNTNKCSKAASLCFVVVRSLPFVICAHTHFLGRFVTRHWKMPTLLTLVKSESRSFFFFSCFFPPPFYLSNTSDRKRSKLVNQTLNSFFQLGPTYFSCSSSSSTLVQLICTKRVTFLALPCLALPYLALPCLALTDWPGTCDALCSAQNR